MVYLNSKYVIIAAGAQQIESGIQRGLVSRNSRRSQKQSPARISTTLDCRKISSMKIMENSKNFSKNLAPYLDLLKQT